MRPRSEHLPIPLRELCQIIREYPPVSPNGTLRWLVTGSTAVYAALDPTSRAAWRIPNDLDIVVLGPPVAYWQNKPHIDAIPQETCFAGSSPPEGFLERTAKQIMLPDGTIGYGVNPPVLATLKLAPYRYGEHVNPRKQDFDTAARLLVLMHRQRYRFPKWPEIIQATLAALPEEIQEGAYAHLTHLAARLGIPTTVFEAPMSKLSVV